MKASVCHDDKCVRHSCYHAAKRERERERVMLEWGT